MPRCADIKVAPTQVKLDETRKGKFIFTVTNALQRSFNARAEIKVEGETKPEWLKLSTPRFELGADKTHSIDVDIECPADTRPGSYKFHLQVVNHGNPDDEYENSATVAIEIQPAPPPPPKFPRWLLAVIIGSVVVTGGIVLAVLELTAPPELGEACDASQECVSGTCVEVVDPTDGKAARATKLCRLVLGDVCTNAGDCITNLCTSGKCAWPEPGADCQTTKDCPPTQSCTELKLETASFSKCLLNEKEACAEPSDCAALWCNPKTKLCPAADGKCSGPDDCRPSLKCVSAKCTVVQAPPPPPPAVPCNPPCGKKWICSNGTCVPNVWKHSASVFMHKLDTGAAKIQVNSAQVQVKPPDKPVRVQVKPPQVKP